ncbi:chromosome segregation in meiosis protein 3 [Colletotrichum scovillei]|uniref:Chromosome segregation in meiosis protein n=1 Tax=Colletotrichum scovillei TaxID=1209932 RepID=A0A9P7RJE4_9PEZI|nr:chromosome segregation in meiosis protein 3 [Colletotrichum scovillei]KAF4779427.1 chromosome segregation in meiosis protein 3 [Colletotrichum scovillei]KAG7058037.1 chromosome segregation in meiosis protein 3 [Colletotrichum scovillei]KAG7076669.1 chromosome segregation in meiosis protein 3 [Colletotrichum scovillei]KAG7083777.1 chromosome segregation in meiosis protein 3 [Colletotrichum scovillei]
MHKAAATLLGHIAHNYDGLNSETSAMASRTVPEYDDLDVYNVDDDFDDPFKSPPPEAKDGSTNKRKQAEALGLDEEVEVAKRVRVPRVKLDEARLLSDNGIPKLRKRAGNLKFKGKGHEFSDAARLLSFYQLWLDDLFPKAKFLDALSMVEKAGHKRQIGLKRMEWINEGKPKPWGANEDRTEDTLGEAPEQTAEPPPAPVSATVPPQQNLGTPERGDILGVEDIYSSTPLARKQDRGVSALQPEEPDDDDLDALMAEADGAAHAQAPIPHEHTGKSAEEEFADEEAAMAEMDGLW